MKKASHHVFVRAAALFGGSAAYAADNTVNGEKPQPTQVEPQPTSASRSSLSPLWLSSLPGASLLRGRTTAAVTVSRTMAAVMAVALLWRWIWHGGPGVTFSFGGGGYAAGKHKKPAAMRAFLVVYEAPWFSASTV